MSGSVSQGTALCGMNNNLCLIQTIQDYYNIPTSTSGYMVTIPATGEYSFLNGVTFDTFIGDPTNQLITQVSGDVTINETMVYFNTVFTGDGEATTTFNMVPNPYNGQNCTVIFMGCTFTTITNFIGAGEIIFSNTLPVQVASWGPPITDLSIGNMIISASGSTQPTMNFQNIASTDSNLVFNCTFNLNTPDVTEFDVYFSGTESSYNVTANDVDLITANRGIARGQQQLARGFMNLHKHNSIKNCRIKTNNRVRLIKN